MALMEGDFFKGWAKPGPRIPALDPISESEEDAALSCDAISGHYRLFQLKEGHRFSTDDLLAAWYGTTYAACARRVLDLGSGIGSVGMIAAWRLQGASFVTVEAQEESVALARRSARHNGIEARYEIRQGDLRDQSVLGEEKFDLILGSPPYFPLESGLWGAHPQKIACRFEVRGTIADYCATAARHLALGGWFSCVFPVSPEAQLKRVEEAALLAGLTLVRRRSIIFREGEAPLIGVFAMMRSEDLPESFRGKTWIEPDLTIRRKDGSVHPEYSAVKLSIGFPP